MFVARQYMSYYKLAMQPCELLYVFSIIAMKCEVGKAPLTNLNCIAPAFSLNNKLFTPGILKSVELKQVSYFRQNFRELCHKSLSKCIIHMLISKFTKVRLSSDGPEFTPLPLP